MSKFYNALIRLVRFALPDMETVWEEPFDGEAAVFCPNHAASFGPIAMCAFFSLRDHCHPWLNAGIMERKEIPAYVRQDYWWEPGCFFEPLLNMTIPYLMALLLPPILGSVPGVPVYHDNRVNDKGEKRPLHIRQSLDVIRPELKGQRAHMPEHPAQEITHLLDVPAFTLDCVAADGACILPAADTFRVLTALEPLTLRWLEGEMELNPGDTVLLPATCPEVGLEGHGRALVSGVGRNA